MSHKLFPERRNPGLGTYPPGSAFILPVNKHWIDTAMTAIPRKYITDAKNQKQAGIVVRETFTG